MNLNYNNEKMLKTTKDENFKTYNETICNDEHFKLSQRNLIMMYIYLYNFFINKNLPDFNTYLNKTTYFNKIIFLKYLIFFRKLNELQKRPLNEINDRILELTKNLEELDNKIKGLESKESYVNKATTLQQEIDTLQEEIKTLELIEDDNNNSKIVEMEETLEEMEDTLENINTNIENITDVEIKKTRINRNIVTLKKNIQTFEKRFDHINDEFIVNTTDILKENLNVDTSIIMTLFDTNIIDNIYNEVITNINNNPVSFNEYLTLFHLNNKPINNSSSDKAIFYIGVHGTLCIVASNNTYLTIKTPVNTTINRWGERGEEIKYFNTMDYTFKQCLLTYGEDLTNFTADTCFDLLGTSKEEFNLHTSQTTPAYCVLEPNNKFNENEKMRIKHYTVDSYDFMIFNIDYTIPDTLFDNLSLIIPELKNIPYNNAENIINLNFLLFTNNINFTIFNLLNINNEEIVNTAGLYSDIGLYNRYYLEQGNTQLQSDLHNFSFPLDIFSFNLNLFTGDFTLDREIYALNNINIHLKYQDVDITFVLLKGDSFSSNPYIIEYFIKTFNSKITIRPGPILGNKEDEIFKENRKNYTTIDKGSTVTCLSKGLSCYKVILSVITNYEILQFCKDANINTCDLYDTSCQSFGYIDDNGKIIDNYTPPQKKTLQRMKTKEDSTMLAKYDNLSDIFFSMDPELDLARDFLVVGNILVKRKLESEVTPEVNSDETPNLKRIKIEGGTQKFINRKKNTRKRKQTKNSYKRKQTKNTNTRKQKKKKTKKMYK
jgi:hypothetical protein